MMGILASDISSDVHEMLGNPCPQVQPVKSPGMGIGLKCVLEAAEGFSAPWGRLEP